MAHSPARASEDLEPLIDELRKKVALSCRIIGSQGVSRGAFGHVSVRIPGTDEVLIKAKGPDEEALEFASERDGIRIDMRGDVVEAPRGLLAPNETAMHLAIYRARPGVTSVIHSHPDWVVVLTACGKPLVPMYGAYDGQAALRLTEVDIPMYPRTLTLVDDAMGDEVVEVMGSHNVVLLKGHGMTVAGASVEEATLTTLAVYELARLNYLAYAIGTPSPVPDLEDHRRRWTQQGDRLRRGTNAAGEPSGWRYQRKLLER